MPFGSCDGLGKVFEDEFGCEARPSGEEVFSDGLAKIVGDGEPGAHVEVRCKVNFCAHGVHVIDGWG